MLGNGYLLVSGDGTLFHLQWNGDRLQSRRLTLTTPLERTRFQAEAPGGVNARLFRVAHLLVQESNGGLQLPPLEQCRALLHVARILARDDRGSATRGRNGPGLAGCSRDPAVPASQGAVLPVRRTAERRPHGAARLEDAAVDGRRPRVRWQVCGTCAAARDRQRLREDAAYLIGRWPCRTVHHRPSKSAGPERDGRRRGLADGTRPGRRGRVERARAGRQLWLAAAHLWGRLRGGLPSAPGARSRRARDLVSSAARGCHRSAFPAGSTYAAHCSSTGGATCSLAHCAPRLCTACIGMPAQLSTSSAWRWGRGFGTSSKTPTAAFRSGPTA